MREEWLDIIPYKGLYQISSLGRVKSLPRKSTSGGILKSSVVKGGGRVHVTLCKNGIRKNYTTRELLKCYFGITTPN
jgi:hypothetical protein